MIAYRNSVKKPALDLNYSMLRYSQERPQEVIPYIGEHNVRADDIESHRKWGLTKEQIAKDLKLPLKGVKQALAWCEENRDLVDKVNEGERRRLSLR